MKSRFTESVAARKPKTQIGRVLTEMTSEPPDAEAATEEEETQGRPAEAEESVARTGKRDAVEAGVPASRPAVPSNGPDPSAEVVRISEGRDRLAALRERLAAASRPRPTGNEPGRTATAVREAVHELRARLEDAVQERREIASQLEETQAALARAQNDLERERRSRADVEAQAEERAKVADEAVAEAEAMAAERDLVLSKLAERRRFDDEQAELLAEAEAVLEREGAEREAAAREMEEMRDLLDLRATEISDAEARLEAEATKRAKVEARCRELEAEVARLSEATEALEAIDATVRQGRRG